MMKATGPRVLVAMDFPERAPCLDLADKLDPADCRLKVGKEMFTRFGPELVHELQSKGFEIFLDLKFHDIPHTVAQAVKAAADLGVWMVNVHASGGARMLQAAAEALAGRAQRPWLIGVTVLTSMEAQDLNATGVQDSPEEQVMRLARLAHDCGLDGVVCSAREAPVLRGTFGRDIERQDLAGGKETGFILVTPGIRPAGSDAGDQRRVVTPAQAVADGSDYLVIGRPITQAPDPAAACRQIVASLS